MIKAWKDPQARDDRATVAILIPFGISERDEDLRVEVVRESTLNLCAKWHRCLRI